MINKSVLFDVVLKSAERKPRTYITRQQVMTNDKNSVEINFRITDATPTELSGATATVYLYMKDGSFFQKTNNDIARENNVFKYVLKENEAKHKGIAQTQIVVKIGTSETASPLFDFDIVGGLETKPIVEREIQDWTTLTAEAKAFVDEIKDKTVDQFVELKMGEELQNLESNYAVKLTELQTNGAALTAQLEQTQEQKADKTAVRQNTDVRPINVSEMDTETKQLFTGGTVAVVGEQGVGNENMKHEAVSVFNTNFVDYELVQGTQIESEVYLWGGDWYVAPATVPITTYKFPLKPNSYVSIENFSGANRFRVAVLTDFYENEPVVPSRIINSDDTKKRVEFFNTNGVEVVIYSANTLNTVSKPIVKQVTKIKTDIPFDLTGSVSPEDTTFLSRQYTDITHVKRSDVSLFLSADGKISINPGGLIKSLTYMIDVEPFQTINVAITGGVYKRFRAAVTDVTVGTAPVLTQIPVDEVITVLDSSNNFEYKNGELSRRVWLYLGLEADGVDATISATAQKIVSNIPFANTDTQKTVERSFGLEYTTISEDTGLPTNVGDYPSMCAVKMDNSRSGEHPRPVGWLYRSNTAPYTFYYSSVTPDNTKEIFEWDTSLAGSTYNTPEYYSPFVTKHGDIVFVFRGDRLSTLTDNEPINPDARRNPIVYPASDYSTPIVVDVGEVKPTAWLQNCGADYIYNQDTFMFSEYTRPLHGNAYVWKVSEPVTSPGSWQISKTFELSGSMNVGMKHSHTVNYDPYSGLIFMTTGDDSSASKIFSSADNGVSWQVQMENSEKYCRVLNFVFKEDSIYWATDSGKIDFHFFFEVPRDPVTKIPDFSNIKELYKFKNKSGQQATYVTVSIDKPSGILFLDRYDANTVEPMEIYFWSFETISMHILDYLTPAGGVSSMFGFRVEAINWYQSIGKDKRIVMGYGHPPNDNDLLGNKINNRINNLALEVKEVVDFG